MKKQREPISDTMLLMSITIGIFVVICTALNLNTILFIVSRLATVALTALVVIFQPELRRAL